MVNWCELLHLRPPLEELSAPSGQACSHHSLRLCLSIVEAGPGEENAHLTHFPTSWQGHNADR